MRSLEEAFEYTSDFSNISDWDPGVTESKKIGTAAMGIGTRFDLTVKVGVGTTSMTYEITQYEPPNRVVLIGSGSKLDATDIITFTEIPDGTLVDYTADLSFKGLLGLAAPLLAGPARTAGTRALDGLAAALDS